MEYFQQRARARAIMRGESPTPPPSHTPATTPGTGQPMRLPKPGERPPSRFAKGVPDHVIERFDAYAARRAPQVPLRKRR